MSSTFITIDPTTTKQVGRKFLKNKSPQIVLFQFVPGHVTKIITDEIAGALSDINAIEAMQHLSMHKNAYIKSRSKKYIPLLRGMADVPVKGDQVLLCTFGGTNYYLGPVNTVNNPNFNTNNLFSLDSYNLNETQFKNTTITEADLEGRSKNFVPIQWKRLQKKFNNELDEVGNSDDTFQFNKDAPKINDIHGDMIFEGRHGNSIRIGSRNIDPYIFISNHRTPSSSEESFADGTLISITANGTLNQHFRKYYDLDKKEIRPTFILASDVKASDYGSGAKLITAMIEDVNGEADPSKIFDKYSDDQVMINSKRIVINANKESMFLSSFQHIHIGSGRSLTISSNMETVIDSNSVRIGKNAEQPIVKGKDLIKILDDLINAIENIVVFPAPASATPINAGGPNVAAQQLLTTVRQNLDSILSAKNYVE